MRSRFFHCAAAVATVALSLALQGQTPAPVSTAPNASLKSPADRAANDLVEYLSRRDALKPGDAAGHLDLAKWARDRELWSPAGEMARQVMALDPENRAAWAILQQADRATELPEEPKVQADLIAEFNRRFKRDAATPAHAALEFKTRHSQHFLICYDTSDAFAASRGGWLEKTYDAFMFFFNMDKLHPAFLQHRLVVILFKNREDYLAYAKETEGADLSWAAGYYSQRTNRTAFYDDSTGPQAQTIEKQVELYRAQLKELNAQIEQARNKSLNGLASNLTAQRNQLGNAIAQINLHVDNALGLMNSVKTAHEAAHQLAFNTGIQTRLVDYPLWFSEGLACSFEMEDRNNRRGPTIINFGRVAECKDAIRRGKMIPLEQLITQPQPAVMDEQTMSVFYGEGWALFHYLYKTNRPGMEKYLLAYRGLPALREIVAVQRRKLFTDSFGDDVPELERKFIAYLKGLPAKAP
jgi:hypothetical protein